MRVLCLLIALLPVSGFGQLQLAKIFSDHMVLQRDVPVHVWGKAPPGVPVTVQLDGQTGTAVPKSDSTWRLDLPAMKASNRPVTMLVQAAEETKLFHDILVGDVWVCIGQSNMEWPMIREAHYGDEIRNSLQPLLRLYNPTYAGKAVYASAYTDSIVQMLYPENFYRGHWTKCDSGTVKDMSAVAYYFGKTVVDSVRFPLGLINLSIGGAPLEAFIHPDAMARDERFREKMAGNWLENKALPVWIRERGSQNIGALHDVPSDKTGKNHSYKPGFAYQEGIEPLLPMPVRGILCYQGESNAQEIARVDEYIALTTLMIRDYRIKWSSTLPFYYVQLSSIDTMNYKGQLWPEFRDEQRKIMNAVPHSGMAVSSDIGSRDDVHPRNKKDVGARLARWALYDTYHLDIVPSGPLPLGASYANGMVTISFQYTAGGLQASDHGVLKGFSLDGKKQAEAFVSGQTVVIRSATKPEFIYYGWSPFSEGNLENTEKLPASTFRLKVQ